MDSIGCILELCPNIQKSNFLFSVDSEVDESRILNIACLQQIDVFETCSQLSYVKSSL